MKPINSYGPADIYLFNIKGGSTRATYEYCLNLRTPERYFDVFIFNFKHALKVSLFWVFLVRIFPHLDWIRRDTLYLSVFSSNEGKYGPENTDIFHAVYFTPLFSVSIVDF